LEPILKYFPNLSENQIKQFAALQNIYKDWNAKINVISRKDIDELYERHVLHALGIAKVCSFLPESTVMDVGTGGGFPGIPLAILFPETQFYLIDIIAKKIKVVNEVVKQLGLMNVLAEQKRASLVNEKYDFIVSRAVTNMPDFVSWTKDKIKKENNHALKNGILYLKGGDLEEELKTYQNVQLFNLADFFEEDFFETKKVVYLPLKYKG
jgi:16S rRNA (guanine527-N7)-methyltransferase